MDAVISLLDKWWACSAAVAAFLRKVELNYIYFIGKKLIISLLFIYFLRLLSNNLNLLYII